LPALRWKGAAQRKPDGIRVVMMVMMVMVMENPKRKRMKHRTRFVLPTFDPFYHSASGRIEQGMIGWMGLN
jgi:hypothetical protein